jgi:hypothetical protein
LQPLGLAIRTVRAARVGTFVPIEAEPAQIFENRFSDTSVDRSASVSSMRRMNVPPCPRASSQLNKAVRALPT